MLRDSSIDITTAMGLVKDTRKSLQNERHRGGDFHRGWMKQAGDVAEEAGMGLFGDESVNKKF